MTIAIVIFVAVILAAGLFSQRAFTERMRRYYDRRCTGRLWRSRFPDAKNEEIRGFLELFAAAFALKKEKKLSFSPDDRVIDVYRTIYPRDWSPDSLECETLVSECEERYGIDITKCCGENPTLGDIFYAIKIRA